MFECIFCLKQYSSNSGRMIHQNQCALNPNKKNYQLGRKAWNAGLNKVTCERVAKQSSTLKEGLRTGRIQQSQKTQDGLKRLSESAKAHGLGGYRPHPNKGQWYCGIWFDSKWEVEVAKSLDESGIKWERPKNGFIWTDSGCKYYPDFYLVEYDVFLDPKNPYLRKKDKEKIEQAQIRNDIRVIVLDETQLSWNVIKTLL